MFNLGDLVKVAEYCPLEDYAGKVGIVTATLGPDYTMANELGYHYNFDSTDGPESCYHRIMLSDGSAYIFPTAELVLMSKAERKTNESR